MSTSSQSQHRIFICHSHIDNEFGTRLAQDLRRALGDESAVWYDVLGGLHGFETWWEKIVEELTARNVFLLVLSPDAMNSHWVRRDINMALNENKFILPVLYRECSVRADLRIFQYVSFLAPKIYEDAFKEVLVALGLPTTGVEKPVQIAPQPEETGTGLVRQMEVAFAKQDWPDVIRKADYLIKRLPGSATATVYRLQGLAFLEEGETQQGQEALEAALALVSERQLRLTLLGDYTTLLASQNQWAKVLKLARDALRLVPNDPGWLATQEQAQSHLAKASPVQSESQAPILDREERFTPIRQSVVQEMNRSVVAQRDLSTAASMLQGKIVTGDFDVFLCHHGIDKSHVKKIGEQLKELGILPWLDEWELRPGLPWQRLLEERIEQIKSAAVFVGKNGMGPWQQLELESFLREFVNRGSPVIPVLLPDAPDEPQLPRFLKGMTWVDFRKQEPDPLKQLIWGITGKR